MLNILIYVLYTLSVINSIKLRSPYTRNLEKYLNRRFGSTASHMNNIKLEEYVKLAKLQSQDAFARIRNNEISVIVAVKISTLGTIIKFNHIPCNAYCKQIENEKCLEVEYFNRNSEGPPEARGDGIRMIQMLKNQCRKIDVNMIALEADGSDPVKLVNNYYMKPELGFIQCSDKYTSNDWPGELIFMVYDLREH